MIDLDLLTELSQPSDEKILLVVIDGLGGLAHPQYDNLSELEYATNKGLLPNLTDFVKNRCTATGLLYPVARGITPGSGTGHLGLFGYDPLKYEAKRGAIEAAGTPNIPAGDIVARMNFCRIDQDGLVADRRAGRLGNSPTRGGELADKLNAKLDIPNATARIVATSDHRGVLVLSRAASTDLPPLDDNITDTDPGKEGKPIAQCRPMDPNNRAAVATAEIVDALSRQAREILAAEKDANMISCRGFARTPDLPQFNDVFSVRSAAIALYSLYRGVAKLVGMTVLDEGAKDLGGEIDLLDRNYDRFDFFFLHYKDPDAMGEDKNFQGKVDALAAFDRLLPRLTDGNRFQVIAITGDHSTPSVLGHHSEHSVPLAVYASTMKGYDRTDQFTERACLHGALGRMRGVELMPILMAKAGKIRKFGG